MKSIKLVTGVVCVSMCLMFGFTASAATYKAYVRVGTAKNSSKSKAKSNAKKSAKRQCEKQGKVKKISISTVCTGKILGKYRCSATAACLVKK